MRCYDWIDMERVISNLLINIPKKNFKENFSNTLKDPKFGVIEFNIQNNVLNIEFKKCFNINIKECNKKDNCPVCFNECNTQLLCNHHICSGCAIKWIKGNKTCPICRTNQNLNTEFTFKIPMKALKQILI